MTGSQPAGIAQNAVVVPLNTVSLNQAAADMTMLTISAGPANTNIGWTAMMADRHDEMARELLIEWYGRSQPDISVATLASALRQVERETLERVWNEINAAIKPGPLQGNGCDETAQRNGLILASNIIAKYLSPIPIANELPTTQELADISTPVKLIDRDQSDEYVPLSLVVAATRLHEAARPADGLDQDAIIPARVFREFVDANAEAKRQMNANACQCEDENGNPLNQCDECPR